VWDILHSPNKLWVPLVTQKYLGTTSIFNVGPSSPSSYTWKSILKVATVLRDGFCIRIGRGNVSFWFDRWLDEGPLCDKVLFMDYQDVPLQVRDVVNDRSCDLSRVRTLMDPLLRN
jgi:hypothetical protein